MTSTSTSTSTADIIDLLEADHQAASRLLACFEDTPAEQREDYFFEVVTTLVPHEVAEEIVVYPAIRRDADGGDDEADARIAEQAEAEELLLEMEKTEADNAEFAAMFDRLRAAVLRHAELEEQYVFPMLAQIADSAKRRELGERYEKAKASAPTHPHPNAPDSPPGNKVLGPVAAFIDRVRDAARF